MSLWQIDVKFPTRCKPLPPGYRISQLDSGHYVWTWAAPGDALDNYTLESGIHWNRWAIWRGCFEHAARRESAAGR